MKSPLKIIFLFVFCVSCTSLQKTEVVATTGELGLIVEREKGQLLVVSHTQHKVLKTITGLGDLSHAALVYSPDQRFAYVFGRDGGLTKVDIVKMQIEKRIVQAGNSIGGTISRDGKLIAVSNYEPGGVKIFDSSTLDMIADIKAEVDGKTSKTVGLVDAPNRKFVFGLLDAGEIWIADFDKIPYEVVKIKNIGKMPYDGLITPDTRHYLAGLFGEDGFARVDMLSPVKTAKRVLSEYRKKDKKLPVYKMPHLGRWAICGEYAFLPAIGENSLLVVKTNDWKLFKKIPTVGQPVFAVHSPDQRYVWVNFAMPENHMVQVIDVSKLEIVSSLNAGKGVLHFEFNPRGDQLWMSVRDENRVDIYDATKFSKLNSIAADRPSGIFFTMRAYENGL